MPRLFRQVWLSAVVRAQYPGARTYGRLLHPIRTLAVREVAASWRLRPCSRGHAVSEYFPQPRPEALCAVRKPQPSFTGSEGGPFGLVERRKSASEGFLSEGGNFHRLLSLAPGCFLRQINDDNAKTICDPQKYTHLFLSGGEVVSTVSKMIHPPARHPIKRCPVCGVSMLASRTEPLHKEFNHFECLNCGLVMNYAEPNTPNMPESDSTRR
jgi:predicted RNA-binding Zn-ribbon protein involved in translation (DUF1610 family)